MTTAEARRMLHEGADAVWPHGGWVKDCWLCKCIDIIEAEAVRPGEVVRMLEGIRRSIEVMGEDGECSLRTIRGVQYITKDDAMSAVDDRLGVMRLRAYADFELAR